MVLVEQTIEGHEVFEGKVIPPLRTDEQKDEPLFLRLVSLQEQLEEVHELTELDLARGVRVDSVEELLRHLFARLDLISLRSAIPRACRSCSGSFPGFPW